MKELVKELRSLEEFQTLLATQPSLTDVDRIAAEAQEILELGFRTGWNDSYALPRDIDAGTGLREGLIVKGINSRCRAVQRLIQHEIQVKGLSQAKIYGAEALTAFALDMRSRFPWYIGSEFAMNEHEKDWLLPIPHEDICNLTYRSDLFDIVTTNEVLEHVPSLDRALEEICRVLKPGGKHIGTFPFNYFTLETEIRARLVDGEIEHLLAPEYHGNPMSGDGSLVFQIPGWDVIQTALESGFSDAYITFVKSVSQGIISEHIGGILVFVAVK